MKLYVSHRRGDCDALTGRLYSELARRLGPQNVLFENDTIPSRTDFRRYLSERITAADAVLVLIGNRWLGDKPPGGRPLLNPLDFIRIEIETAVQQKIPLIPVLVGGREQMPAAEELPATLQAITAQTGWVIRDDSELPANLERLTNQLERLPPKQPGKKPLPASTSAPKAMGRLVVAVTLATLVFALFFAWTKFYPGKGRDRYRPENARIGAADANQVEFDQNLLTPTPATEP